MSNPRSFASALKRAWRSLTHRPGSFVIAVLSLAIALGLATTVIAQIDALMNPVSAARDAKHLYLLTVGGAAQPGKPGPTHADVLPVLRATSVIETATSVEQAGASAFVAELMDYDAPMWRVAPELFRITGVRPSLGRVFVESDATSQDVVVVSQSFWQKHFAGRVAIDAAAISYGRSDRQQARVIGVVPDVHALIRIGSHGLGFSPGVYLPKPAVPSDVYQHYIVRVKRGVSQADLDQAVTASAQQLVDRFGVGSRKLFIRSATFKPDPLQLTAFHRALAGASVFILLIACANVSALMLARSVTQRRDQALKRALGASPFDLLRDVTAELSIVGTLGCVLGLVIGAWAMQIMIATTPPELAWLGFAEPRWSLRVFGALLIAVFATVALSSLVPAWQVSKLDPADPLKDAAGTTTGRLSKRFQALVVAELALAMILLFGASLVTKTASNVAAFDFGYDARSLLDIQPGGTRVVKELRPPDPKNRYEVAAQRRTITEATFAGIVEKVRQTPGVREASWIQWRSGEFPTMGVASDAKYSLDTAGFRPRVLGVGANFIRTIGVPLIAGRDFVDADHEKGALILDEASAQGLFPNGDAVGHLVSFLHNGQAVGGWIPVVGVVRNAIHVLPAYPEMPVARSIYMAYPNTYAVEPRLIVRPEPGAGDIMPTVSAVVRDLVPTGASSGGKWIARYDEILRGRTFVAGIFVTLSIASLILATAGLFGVLSYAVGQRMREFAVRVALGARTPNIVRLVIRDGIVMTLGGTAVGGIIAMIAGFAVYDWLWGVYPVDAGALIVAETVLIVVTVSSAIGPALRASRANPVEVMRAT